MWQCLEPSPDIKMVTGSISICGPSTWSLPVLPKHMWVFSGLPHKKKNFMWTFLHNIFASDYHLKVQVFTDLFLSLDELLFFHRFNLIYILSYINRHVHFCSENNKPSSSRKLWLFTQHAPVWTDGTCGVQTLWNIHVLRPSDLNQLPGVWRNSLRTFQLI